MPGTRGVRRRYPTRSQRGGPQRGGPQRDIPQRGRTSAGPTSARRSSAGRDLGGANLSGANLHRGEPHRGEPRRGEPQRGGSRRCELRQHRLQRRSHRLPYIRHISVASKTGEGQAAEAWSSQVGASPRSPSITSRWRSSSISSSTTRRSATSSTPSAPRQWVFFGRFTDERKAVLDALREELRKRDYLPILFDFAAPATRDISETVSRYWPAWPVS